MRPVRSLPAAMRLHLENDIDNRRLKFWRKVDRESAIGVMKNSMFWALSEYPVDQETVCRQLVDVRVVGSAADLF